jgi:hypothetical protein
MAKVDILKLDQATKDKYQITDNTFKVAVKDNPKDLVEVEIGDSKTLTSFLPQQKISRWDNEVNCSIRLKHTEKIPTVIAEDGKIKWKGKDVEAHFYDFTNEEHPEGASEFEVVLKSKPLTNVVEFTVVDKDVDYFYQPALTPEEIDEGASRPENVVGSYAVYAKTPKTNWTGGKEYKTGKIGHIFRPKIIDSAGTEVWGDLHIENGILSVTIPQDFLDKAVYPVRHAAGLTFGYTSVGGSEYSNNVNFITTSGTTYTGATGTGVSMSIYGRNGTVNGNFQGAIYNNTTLVGATSAGAVTSNTSQWWTATFASEPTLSATAYYLAQNVDNSSIIYNGDTVAGGSPKFKYSFTNYGTWPNPITWTNHASIQKTYSIYATYTASGGATTNSNFLQFMGNQPQQ